MGRASARIIFRHMAPSFLSHIIAEVSLAIPGMILAETALSFLGLGLQPPMVSWGVLLQEAQNIRAIATAPWLFAPGIAVVIAVLALNFVGDGLRDAADPYGNKLGHGRDRRRHRARGRRICSTWFEPRREIVKAVDDVSLTLRRGRTLCVVGESGSGKSVTARSILNIVPKPGRIVGGQVLLHGSTVEWAGGKPIDLAALNPRGRRIRGIRGPRDRDDLPGADGKPEPRSHHRQRRSSRPSGCTAG